MEFRFSQKVSQISGAAIEEILKYAGDPTVISLAGGNTGHGGPFRRRSWARLPRNC